MAALLACVVGSTAGGVWASAQVIAPTRFGPLEYYYSPFETPGSIPAPTIASSGGVLSTSLKSGVPGTVIHVSGSGFPRDSIITIYFGSAAAAMVATDAQGTFQTALGVPHLPPGLVTVTATGANNVNPPTFVIVAPPHPSVVAVTPALPQTGFQIVPAQALAVTSVSAHPVPAAAAIAQMQAQILAIQQQLAALIERINALVAHR